jgi:hypothetical protein
VPDTFSDRLATLRAQGIAALVRHSRDPRRFGAAETHERLWFAANAARYALAEGNTVLAGRRVPNTGTGLPVGEGIPLLPAGTRWAVDETTAGTVTLTLDIAAIAGATATVRPPEGFSFTATASSVPTRTTITFAAPLDGVYTVALLVGKITIAKVLVPVTRALFRLVREDSRAQASAFRRLQPPAPSAAQRLRLALLVCAESAVQTGQQSLANTLLGAAAAVPAPALPTALYPAARG